MYAFLMNLMSKMFGNTAKKNMEKNTTDNAVSEGNWMGPDGTESGPGVPEDWYLSYDGPAPVERALMHPITLLTEVQVFFQLNFMLKNGEFLRVLKKKPKKL